MSEHLGGKWERIERETKELQSELGGGRHVRGMMCSRGTSGGRSDSEGVFKIVFPCLSVGCQSETGTSISFIKVSAVVLRVIIHNNLIDMIPPF